MKLLKVKLLNRREPFSILVGDYAPLSEIQQRIFDREGIPFAQILVMGRCISGAGPLKNGDMLYVVGRGSAPRVAPILAPTAISNIAPFQVPTIPEGVAAQFKLQCDAQSDRCTLAYTTDNVQLRAKWLTPLEDTTSTPTAQTLQAIQSNVQPKVSEGNIVRRMRLDTTADETLLPNNESNSAWTSMVHKSFQNHWPLVLRPDDIHLLILTALANFFKQYPEDLRDTAVTFKDKKELYVEMESENFEATSGQIFLEFLEQIATYVPPEVMDLMLTQFSTTTPEETHIKVITLMGTFSAYFNYTVGGRCFIPKFILEGTVEDWKKVSELTQAFITALKLRELKAGLEKSKNSTNMGIPLLLLWLERLSPVLTEFYKARCGNPNSAFWSSFYRYNSGSGHADINGYMMLFFPFLVSQNKLHPNPLVLDSKGVRIGGTGVALDVIPCSFVEVPFLRELYKKKYNATIVGGVVACTVDNNTKQLRTRNTYSIFYDNDRPAFKASDKAVDEAAAKPPRKLPAASRWTALFAPRTLLNNSDATSSTVTAPQKAKAIPRTVPATPPAAALTHKKEDNKFDVLNFINTNLSAYQKQGKKFWLFDKHADRNIVIVELTKNIQDITNKKMLITSEREAIAKQLLNAKNTTLASHRKNSFFGYLGITSSRLVESLDVCIKELATHTEKSLKI